jgi:hypothetical protein
MLAPFLKAGYYKLEIICKQSSKTLVLLVSVAQQGRKILIRSCRLKE